MKFGGPWPSCLATPLIATPMIQPVVSYDMSTAYSKKWNFL